MQVRVRNINYALTGSVDGKGKIIPFRLEPNVWTAVPEEVFIHLKNKYGDNRYADVPNSLPAKGDEYTVQPGQTRPECVNSQYLVEFRS